MVLRWCWTGNRREMRSMWNLRVASAVAVLWIFQYSVSPVICEEFDPEWAADADCLYESEEICNRADLMGCVWCDLPRRCYSASRSLELGPFCSRPMQQKIIEIGTCEDIGDEQVCSLSKNCLWCRSDEVNDGCFNLLESVRLPKHIFTCSERNPGGRNVSASS